MSMSNRSRVSSSRGRRARAPWKGRERSFARRRPTLIPRARAAGTVNATGIPGGSGEGRMLRACRVSYGPAGSPQHPSRSALFRFLWTRSERPRTAGCRHAKAALCGLSPSASRARASCHAGGSAKGQELRDRQVRMPHFATPQRRKAPSERTQGARRTREDKGTRGARRKRKDKGTQG